MDFEQTAKSMLAALGSLGVSKLIAYDMTDKPQYTKYLFVCSAKNENEVLAAATGIEQFALNNGITLLRREGIHRPNWVVLDFLDFVVHILCENEREKYKLDALYKSHKTLVI